MLENDAGKPQAVPLRFGDGHKIAARTDFAGGFVAARRANLVRSRFREPQIEMAHGAGGKATRRLVDGLFVPLLYDVAPDHLGDAAPVEINGMPVALTTDSFVVTPLVSDNGVPGTLTDGNLVNAWGLAAAPESRRRR